jgi:hypothetical protein
MSIKPATARKRAQRAFPLPAACEKCGKVGKVTRHHPNIEEPLVVEMLCYTCHARADQALGKVRKRPTKICTICGREFSEYTHSRVKTCGRACLSEAGRRNELKRRRPGRATGSAVSPA